MKSSTKSIGHYQIWLATKMTPNAGKLGAVRRQEGAKNYSDDVEVKGPGAPIVSPNKNNFLRPIERSTRAILPAIGVDIFYRAPPCTLG